MLGDGLADWFHSRFGNPLGVLSGMALGAMLLSSAASILHALDGLGRLGRLLGYRGQNMAQEPWYALLPMIFIYLLLFDDLVAASVLTSAIALVYVSVMGFRLLALALGGRIEPRHDEDEEQIWPIYTILVPLYREEAVAQKILRNLHALDYPKDRLDVKFLLEADDPGTLAALERDGIPSWCEVLVVPDAQPKTKPRACNHGLQRARGEFLVIFDAEDRPEPNQLKKAVRAFAKAAGRVACLQAQLAYHNHRQNLLTRWFAIEYNVWFQRYLRGLHRLGGPLPLGGTSNHFKVSILRQLDGWDPFNVTEDCDLGIRLHLAGHRTATLASVTWEEANSRVGNWLRQRSRWLKGYLITHLVWSRHPLRLLWRLGPLGCFRYLASILGIAGLAVLNLPLWIMLGLYSSFLARDMGQGWGLMELLSTPPVRGDDRLSWPLLYIGSEESPFWAAVADFLGHVGPLPQQDPWWAMLSFVFAIVTLVLLCSNLIFILINVLFGHRPGQRGLIWAALISPLYWVLISLGAWKGLWQLCFNPHKWEKTVHGLDHQEAAEKDES
ncbi:MAG: glycosyltransferase [Planctomycetota bacterium]|nr:MAG: glycosyltransferase [Planctomycetota bacterium]